MYTVKQLADLAGISRRTVQYYDRIDLLKPEEVRGNGYRYYGEASLYRLQQILLYKEMGMELSRIGEILGNRDYDVLAALEEHRKVLGTRLSRLETLMATVDDTIGRLKGENEMKDKELFNGLTKEQEAEYSQEAIDRWGDKARESQEKWNGYDEEQKQDIMDEGKDIYRGLASLVAADPASEPVQTLIARWHEHLKNFYEPTPEMLAGLGDMYCDDPRFRKNIGAYHEDLPEFMREAIRIYLRQS